jgi:rifampicin phosphotransferase
MINAELYSLAEEVQRAPQLRQLFRDHSSRDIIELKLLTAFREFSVRFDSFLRVHGHREVEFDAYHPTWIEIPWVVLDHIRLLVDASASGSSSPAQGDATRPSKHALRLAPAERERELRLRMHKAEIELFERLTPSLHFFFHEFIRLARAYTSLDDLEHYQTTRLTLPLRKGLRELGRRLYVRSVIGDPMDIFFAHAAALEQAVHANDDKRWRALGESTRAEKAAYLSDCQRTPAWNLDPASPAAAKGADAQTLPPSAPVADASEPSADHATAPTSILSGLPGSPGQAQGPAFLVRGIEDFAGFLKGAVIVARTTNPTWTPLFYNAVAVVTESGGPLSHGAVTAREMQIPAVMSVRNCMSTFKNGDMLRVDGSRGVVTLLKRSINSA